MINAERIVNGPSNISINELARELSRMLKSLENLLIITPDGIRSKN